MYMQYFIYLNSLNNTQKKEQIVILGIFWISLLIIAGILEVIKYKYKDKIKNKKLKKFLEKI